MTRNFKSERLQRFYLNIDDVFVSGDPKRHHIRSRLAPVPEPALHFSDFRVRDMMADEMIAEQVESVEDMVIENATPKICQVTLAAEVQYFAVTTVAGKRLSLSNIC